jgi:antitoxin FitA
MESIQMPTITVKNIPPEIYEKLKQSAKANHRSINSEVIASIEKVVGCRHIQPDLLLATARKLRSTTASHPITEDELNTMKQAGRL